MSHVDPFVVPIPKKLLDDPELSGFFRFWVQWSHDMWVAMDQGDATDDLRINSLYPVPVFNEDAQIIVTSTDYTTTGNMLVIATAACTITLDSSPADKQKTTVKAATTGMVTVSGTIDGDTSFLIANYDAVDLIYSADNGEWSIT